jgi:hypothetical protein
VDVNRRNFENFSKIKKAGYSSILCENQLKEMGDVLETNFTFLFIRQVSRKF